MVLHALHKVHDPTNGRVSIDDEPWQSRLIVFQLLPGIVDIQIPYKHSHRDLPCLDIQAAADDVETPSFSGRHVSSDAFNRTDT